MPPVSAAPSCDVGGCGCQGIHHPKGQTLSLLFYCAVLIEHPCCGVLQLAVRVLAFAPSSGFALSAAEGERLVAVWPTPDRAVSSKTKNKGLAAASLAVEQPVVGLATAGKLIL